MPVYITCPSCSRRGSLPDTFPGGRVKCPNCGVVNEFTSSGGAKPTAPAPAAAPASPRPSSQPQAQPRPQPKPQPAPQPSSRPAFMDDLDDVEEPVSAPLQRAGSTRAKEQAKPKSTLPIVLGVGGGVCLLLAVVVGIVAFNSTPNDSLPSAPVITQGGEAGGSVEPLQLGSGYPGGAANVGSPGGYAANSPISSYTPPPIPNGQVIPRVEDATVYIKVSQGKNAGSGTGFVFRHIDSSTVLVATNRHVIHHSAKDDDDDDDEELEPKSGQSKVQAPPTEIKVVFRSGKGQGQEQELPAIVLAADTTGDTSRDLAILQVNGVTNPPIPLGFNRTEPIIGMSLMIAGYPFGKALNIASRGNPSITINKASASSLRRDDRGQLSMIQVDGSVQPGNSGGPVVDEHGQLVGVTVAKLRMADGIGLIIPCAHLEELLEGRIGKILLDLVSNQAGKYEFQMKVDLADPMKRLKDVHVRVAPLVGEPPKPPTGQTMAEPMPNTQPFALTIDQSTKTAAAKFSVPLANSPNRVLVQVTFTAGNGRMYLTMPMPYELPAQPGRVVALGGRDADAEAKLTKGMVERLGPLVDPDKDCKLTKDKKAIKIDVPAKMHMLSPQLVNAKKKQGLNAPMTLAQVDGDFLIHVLVAGDFSPGTQTYTNPKTGRSLPYTFQGAGIVLWQDEGNFIRLERSTLKEGNNLSLSHRLIIEVYRDGKEAGQPFYLQVPEGPMSVMMLRRNGKIRCLWSNDGKQWMALQEIAEEYAGKIKVGLDAVNMSKKPMTALFQHFMLLDDKDKLSERFKELD